MNYWDSVGRWINTLLVFIVGVLAFDALFRLLEANESNVIVAFVRGLALVFLVPFQGMFGEQDYVLTTLIGVLGYSLLAGIALGVLRSLQASRAEPAPPVQDGERATPMTLEAPRERPRAVEGTTEATPRRAAAGPERQERADGSLRPVEPTERPAPGERSDGARANGRQRSARARAGTDGVERGTSGPDTGTRRQRGRARDRAAARRPGGRTPEADTGS